MGFLDFFRRNKKPKTEAVKIRQPSPEQAQFAEAVLTIISPTVEAFGFVRHCTEIDQHATEIIFRKGSQYIKIDSSTYPTDYPYFYNIVLGDGDSKARPESDWNAVALWRLKTKVEPTAKAKEYTFPVGEHIRFSVLNANQELTKYASSFLRGDLTLFLECRSALNQAREPYKIHSPDEAGNYTTTDEPASVEMKRRFS